MSGTWGNQLLTGLSESSLTARLAVIRLDRTERPDAGTGIYTRLGPLSKPMSSFPSLKKKKKKSPGNSKCLYIHIAA